MSPPAPLPSVPDAIFWRRLRRRAGRLDARLVGRVLVLVLAARQPGLPGWARATVHGALARAVAPRTRAGDAPAALLADAHRAVAPFVSATTRARARQQLDAWRQGRP